MGYVGSILYVPLLASAQLNTLIFLSYLEYQKGCFGLLPCEILTYSTEEINEYIKEHIECSNQTNTVLALTVIFQFDHGSISRFNHLPAFFFVRRSIFSKSSANVCVVVIFENKTLTTDSNP